MNSGNMAFGKYISMSINLSELLVALSYKVLLAYSSGV